MSKKLRLSYTKLSFYLTCPQRYYYRYIEKKPFYPSIMMKYGGNIHRTVKDLSEIININGKVDLKTQKDIYEKQWIDVSLDHIKNLELKEAGIQQIQDFVDTNKSIIGNTIFLEKSFSFPLEDITLCGYIDRIDRISESNVEIIDYKTGNLRELYPDDLQLNFYALVCRDHLNLIPAKLSLYFLKSNQKLSVNSDNTYINMTKELTLKTADKILSKDFSLTQDVSQHCKECCYKRICSVSS